jgi:serine/threonine protein phosphatase 1
MLFAIGDVHGHFVKLQNLMERCRAYAAAESQPARFVLLGDYIDRGPDSGRVLEYLASRPPDVLAVMGNHEDMLLQSLDDTDAADRWFRNGGLATLDSYAVLAASEIPAAHVDLIRSLPVFIDDGLRLFVHAGIDPANPNGRDPHILMWTRKHPPENAHLPRFIVHGHTPTASHRPELLANRLNLDTGAGWGRKLSAAAFHDGKSRPVAFLNDLGEMSEVR